MFRAGKVSSNYMYIVMLEHLHQNVNKIKLILNQKPSFKNMKYIISQCRK